jgi:hypothetical protein
MAGYSGTPLPKKLGIKPGFKVALPDLPPEVKSELKTALTECQDASSVKTALDFVLLPSKSQSDLKKKFPQWSKRLAPAGMLWVSWPKKVLDSRPISTKTKSGRLGLRRASWT